MHGREPAHRAREAVWRGFCGRPHVRLNWKTLAVGLQARTALFNLSRIRDVYFLDLTDSAGA